MSKKRAEYSENFKSEAVVKIRENNGNISQRTRHTHEHACQLHRLANGGQLKGTDSYNPELMAALDEIKELKKQLKIAQEEREILKKATAYFAKKQ